MMKSVVYILLIVISSSVVARNSMTADTSWILVKRSKDVCLFERWVWLNDTLRIRERKGEFIANCNISEVSKYLFNVENLKDWMNGVKEITQIPSNDSCRRAYVRMNLPWPFSDRDLSAKLFVEQCDVQCVRIRIVNDTHSYRRNERAINIKHYDACWTLSGLAERKTKIEFVTFSNEAPVFPQWIQEPVLKSVFLNNLKRLKSCLAIM